MSQPVNLSDELVADARLTAENFPLLLAPHGLWGAWVDAKRDIARASIEAGGSISAAHGSSRAGEVDLVPLEMGGAYDVMKKIKRALDPNNIMNPGKYLLDSAYEDD
jgi:glycolate oxidase